DAGGRRARAGRNAADRDGVPEVAAETVTSELHARGQARDVIDRAHALHFHLRFAERADADGDVANVFLASRGRHDDLFERDGLLRAVTGARSSSGRAVRPRARFGLRQTESRPEIA